MVVVLDEIVVNNIVFFFYVDLIEYYGDEDVNYYVFGVSIEVWL